ncbi:MAG: FliI/YscN family ATPase [Planctomycetaceae bacterium]
MLTLEEQVRRTLPVALTGRVSHVTGLTATVVGFPAPLGAQCAIIRENCPPLEAEVVGFRDAETLLFPYGDLTGISRGNRVTLKVSAPSVCVGEGLLGRVLDGRGRFIDGLPPAALSRRAPLISEPVPPLARPPIAEPLATGVRAIDALLTCGRGQRLGIFAGSGVGKSVLLGQLARNSDALVNVIVLVGERGREVREFVERKLGDEGLRRSVVVAATNDEPALLRVRAAWLGAAVAEYFRDTGRDVLLLMDSVTRFAAAQREIGLAAGEAPAARGYPPSVFGLLPRLLERSGRTARGSITGLYTVLVEGDDENEPISDSVRGILDGHIWLSRKLAHQAHWPAIDLLASVSRSMPDIISAEQGEAAAAIKEMLAARARAEDLLAVGAYQPGSNRLVDAAERLREPLLQFLRQRADECCTLAEAREGLLRLRRMLGD